MNRKWYLLALYVSLLLTSCKGPDGVDKPDPPEGTFVFGGKGDESGRDLIETPDGDILALGASDSHNDKGDYDAFLVKLNAAGVEQWARTYGTSGMDEVGEKIIATLDGGYLIAGVASDGAVNFSYFVYKLNAQFETEWSRSQVISGQTYYGITRCNGLFELPDGGYIMGFSTSQNPTVVVLGEMGNEVQRRTYTEARISSFAEFLERLPDGRFAFCATTYDNINYQQAPTLYMLDQTGTQMWSVIVDAEINSLIYTNGFSVLANGNFLVIAKRADSGEDYLVEFDSTGNTVWWSAGGVNTRTGRVIDLPDGTFRVAGTQLSGYEGDYVYPTNRTDVLLQGFDAVGTLLFTEIWGDNYPPDQGSSIIRTSDGRLALIGTTGTYGSGNTDIFLIFFPE